MQETATDLLIRRFQFRYRSIVDYNHYEAEGRFIRTERQRVSAEKLADQETYTGTLRAGSRKRLTKCLENLIQHAKAKTVLHEGKPLKFSANFITLTLYNKGQFITGKEASDTVMQPFLRWLRDEFTVDKKKPLYLWKAELQGKRKDVAQLHFHLITDTYIHKDVLRDKWNELQIKAGYLDLDAYEREFGHRFVPSTKIHALYRKRDPVAYCKKEIVDYCDVVNTTYKKALAREYDKKAAIVCGPVEKEVYSSIVNEVTKDIQNTYTVGGKVWDCCTALKSMGLHTEEVAMYHNNCVSQDEEIVQNLEKEIKAGNVISVKTEHCTIHKFRRGHTWEILPRKQRINYFNRANLLQQYERKAPDKPPQPAESPPKQVNFYKHYDLFNPW